MAVRGGCPVTALRRDEDPKPSPGSVDTARAQVVATPVSDQGVAKRFLELLSDGAVALEREHRPGHVTGSAMVLHSDRKRCLLLFHTKLRRWLQPGGHADGDGDLAHVAWREASEETGIVGLTVFQPAIDLDIHEVAPRGEDAHLHFDVRFVVLAPRDAVLDGNHESEDMRWVAFDDLARYGVDEGLKRLAAVAAEIVSGRTAT